MKNSLRNIKGLIIFFIAMLFLSGLTAIPIESELAFVRRFFPLGSPVGDWLDKVYLAVRDTNNNHPFLSYGYDWLAFAHFVLAILFIGPLKHPVRNKWVIEFGIIACLLIIPFALIAGQARGIPFWWRLVDCSFGIIGLMSIRYLPQKNKSPRIN